VLQRASYRSLVVVRAFPALQAQQDHIASSFFQHATDSSFAKIARLPIFTMKGYIGDWKVKMRILRSQVNERIRSTPLR